jgi:ribosomal protein S18 acetylase RimI-like enzyme
MNIRPYTSADLDAVVAIFRSNIPKYFGPEEESGLYDFLSEFAADYFVGEAEGEVVAAGGIALNDDETVSLCWGMVREDHLGTGLGRRLTEYRIKKSLEKFGNRALITRTSQHTQGFYEKLGFRLVEHIPDGHGPGIDFCLMRREG